jgi:hypothetical protein
MSPNSIRCTLVGGAAVTLAILMSAAASAAEAVDAAPPPTPVILAQGAAPTAPSANAVAAEQVFPAYQRGVREAAKQGNEALRRYVWRTRMIHNFYYHDFAPKE